MKRKLFLPLLMSLVLLFSLSIAKADKKDNKKTVVYNAQIHCMSCKAKLEKNLPFEKGVKNFKIDMKKKTILVTFRIDKTDSLKIQSAIEKCGIKIVAPETKKCSCDKCDKKHEHEKCSSNCK